MKRPYPQVTEIWKFGRISDSETRFVALSGCLSSEVTPVKLQTLYVTHTEQRSHIAELQANSTGLTEVRKA